MKLGYTPEQTSEIVSYIDKEGKMEGAPHFKAEHLPVFDCSLAQAGGALDCLDWPREDDGGGAAVPFRRDFKDDQHAGRFDD